MTTAREQTSEIWREISENGINKIDNSKNGQCNHGFPGKNKNWLVVRNDSESCGQINALVWRKVTTCNMFLRIAIFCHHAKAYYIAYF